MAATDNTVAMDDAEAQKRKAILAIMLDTSLTEAEKARKRQELMMGNWNKAKQQADKSEGSDAESEDASSDEEEAPAATTKLQEHLKCAVCMELCVRPVTAPCQHNYCLACFTKWTNQGKKTCPTCRHTLPTKFIQNPRINTALTVAIRLAKNPPKPVSVVLKERVRVEVEQRPDEAFVTEKAVRNGRANAASGRIMVTVPNDHFGPIGPEHDPERKRGVQVGDHWKDRLDCRQWGAHFPHVAGIAGQSNVGAQSVVLSGGYVDDRDEGEWFLYTGSGGRDLSGNKRTNKEQSFDQDFTLMNLALRMSCIHGLPVRVVRSHKEKRSAYAPTKDQPVRYDGVYRILRCWRKPGVSSQFLVCRYLFVRCDNSPAPWSSDESGDQVRLEIPKEAAKEMKQAEGEVFEMGDEPYWDFNTETQQWGWTRPSPTLHTNPAARLRKEADPSKQSRAKLTEHERALKQFHCGACHKVLVQPIVTPCGHQFCKGCLVKAFQGIETIQMPSVGPRTLRVRKNTKPCPECKADLCDFMTHAQVNGEMQEVISKLQESAATARAELERLKAEAAEAAARGGSKKSEGGEEDEENGCVGEEDEVDTEAADDVEEGSGGGSDEEAEEEKPATKKAKTGKTSGASAAAKTTPAKKATGKRGRGAADGGSAKEEVEGAAAACDKKPAAKKRPKVEPASNGAAQQTPPSAPAAEVHGAADAGGGDMEVCGAETTVAVQEAGPANNPVPSFRFALELRTMMEEFPEADEDLVRILLQDQEGDLKDVRFQLRKLLAPAAKPTKKRAKKEQSSAAPAGTTAAAGTSAATGVAAADATVADSDKMDVDETNKAATPEITTAGETKPDEESAEDGGSDGAAAATAEGGPSKKAKTEKPKKSGKKRGSKDTSPSEDASKE